MGGTEIKEEGSFKKELVKCNESRKMSSLVATRGITVLQFECGVGTGSVGCSLW